MFYRLEFDLDQLIATELAITDNPGIGIKDGVMFSNHLKRDFFEPSTHLELNKDQQIIASVALRPDKWVERIDPNTNELYYITFSPNQVALFKDAFEKNGALFNLDHTGKKFDSDLIYSEIIDEGKIKEVKDRFSYNGDIKVGDYFVAVKIEKEEDWSYLKKGGFNSFSIQAWFDKSKIEFNKINKDSMEKELKDYTKDELLTALSKIEGTETVKIESSENTDVKEEVELEQDMDTITDETNQEQASEFVMTEAMYQAIIDMIAELQLKLDESVREVDQEKEMVELSVQSPLSKPALFLRGLNK